MKRIVDLRPRDKITNKELASIFGCATQGGMRRSRPTDIKPTDTLVIIFNHINPIYHDRWVGDRWNGGILYYTGMRRVGNQSCEYKQNKTLRDSDFNDVSVYLFERCYPNQYTFIGQVALAGKPFCEEQPDINDVPRLACVFPVKIIGDKNHLSNNEGDESAAVAEEAKRCAKKNCQSCCVWGKASFNNKRW
jgi:5-methylcytosine-specific restriction protein A